PLVDSREAALSATLFERSALRKTDRHHPVPLALHEHRQQQQAHRTTRGSRRSRLQRSSYRRPFVATLLRVTAKGRHNVLSLSRTRPAGPHRATRSVARTEARKRRVSYGRVSAAAKS